MTEPQKKVTDPTQMDVSELRKRARHHILHGAVTDTYEGDLKRSIQLLQEALATEIVCMLRYRSHYYLADGIQAPSVAPEFLEHADEELDHAHRLSERIKQLGGEPNWSPHGITERSHAEFTGGDTLVALIREDLIAERIAIDSYRAMVQYFGNSDPTSRRLLERILAKEEEHAQELQDLLLTLDPQRKPSTHDRSVA
jgi:bacterioferritin